MHVSLFARCEGARRGRKDVRVIFSMGSGRN
jgi:hypothetical protein